MSSRKRRDEVLDEDGNALPPPDPGSPVAQAIYLLEYARLRGFQIGPNLQIGDVIMNVRDLRQEAQAAKDRVKARGAELVPESDMALLLTPEG